MSTNFYFNLNGMLLFVAADGDGLYNKLSRAKKFDNVEETRRVTTTISNGNKLFSSWALRNLGSTIEESGDGIIVEVGAAGLSELEDIRGQYVGTTTCTVSVGIGKKMSEAVRALKAAKIKGGNRSVFYDKDVEDVIKDNEEGLEKTEALQKAQANRMGGEGQHKENADATSLNTLQTPAAPLTNQTTQEALYNKAIPGPGEVQGGPEALQFQFQSAPKMNLQQTAQEFKNHADKQEASDKAQNLKTSEGYQEVKKKVAEALVNIKNQMQMIGQLRTQAPDTYEAIMGVVRGIIMLGRLLSDTDERIKKAESLVKGLPAEPAPGVSNNLDGGDPAGGALGFGSDAFGKADIDPSSLDQEQLAIGTQKEMQEHGLDFDTAQKIASDHLKEDPKYYSSEDPLAKTEFFFDSDLTGSNIKQLQYDGPAKVGGSHQKHFFIYPYDNTKYVFKELPDKCQAIAAESASRLAEAVSPPHRKYPVRVHHLVGRSGVMQPEVAGHDLHDIPPTELTVVELLDVFNEFFVDFLLGNATTDGQKLLRTVDGRIVGIDKKDSFKNFDNIGPYYQTMFDAIKAGIIRLDEGTLDPILDGLANLPDDEYLDNVGEYAQCMWPEDTQQQVAFCKQLLDRKRNIKVLFIDLLKQQLNKGERPEYGKMRAHIKLPLGSSVFGKVKVRHWDGSESWKSVKAGAIPGLDPGMANEGHPVSAKNPSAK